MRNYGKESINSFYSSSYTLEREPPVFIATACNSANNTERPLDTYVSTVKILVQWKLLPKS